MTTTVTVTVTVAVTVTVVTGSMVLSVSGNGRYLLEDGSPFLMIGDSPQGMIPQLTPANMATYLSNRAGYGVNMVQVHLLAGATFGGNSTTFEAQDTTTPFTTTGDISTPRESFFSQVDDMLNLAKSYDIHVMLTAAETIDAEGLFSSNGNTKCFNFGAYLGARYKNFTNLIWNVGNDWQDWSTNNTARDAIQNVVDGILSEDTNHLMTAWLDYLVSASRDIEGDWGSSRISLDGVYTYSPTYVKTYTEYALNPVKPIFGMESNYEGESLRGYLTTGYYVRKQNYWWMLSGCCGITYCNDEIWLFAAGWDSHLDSYDGPAELVHLRNLFEAYNWWLMVPDTAHDIVTSGYGTQSVTESDDIDTNDYAPCAYIAGVDLAFIYMPTNRTMTVDMSQFSATVTARWFDPTDGSYTADAASPVANTGTHEFSRATSNNGGDADWILVLEV